MKIIFPHGEVTREETEGMLQFAIEGRKRIKDQLMRIDMTYEPVKFGYKQDQKESLVKTLEERQYPRYYSSSSESSDVEEEPDPTTNEAGGTSETAPKKNNVLIEKHLVFAENQKGISYDDLLGPYLKGASKIILTDPYIRLLYQAKNLMELLETIAKIKPDDEEVHFHLLTVQDPVKNEKQKEYLKKIQENIWRAGIRFPWEYDKNKTIHARRIVTDTGWKILLDRGLDVFQQYSLNQMFSLNARL